MGRTAPFLVPLKIYVDFQAYFFDNGGFEVARRLFRASDAWCCVRSRKPQPDFFYLENKFPLLASIVSFSYYLQSILW